MTWLPSLDLMQMALGSAVVHFLWQGALIGVGGLLVLRCVPHGNPRARYAAACGAMLVAVTAFLCTLIPALRAEAAGMAWGLPDSDWNAGLRGLPESDLRGLAGLGLMDLGEIAGAGVRFGPMESVGLLWMVGFGLLLLRWIRGVAWTISIRRGAALPWDSPWQRMLDRVRRESGVRTRVRILVRDSVDSPAVVGWFAPVLVLPLYALTSLTPEQLRSVFAHELAHVRRLDTWVNLLQTWAEALLFFHPVTWWLSKVIREEREHCCDASAVRVTGAPRRLAEALTCLETLRTQNSPAVLAAEATGGHLMKRIQRILDPRSTQFDRPIRWRSGSVLAAGALALAMGMTQVAVAGSPAPSWTAEEPSVHNDWDQDARVEEYRRIAVRIEEAVEAGALSAEAAEQTLLALRKSMFRTPETRSGPDPRLEKYKAFEGEIHDGVRAGKITKEQAEEKLIELRRELFGDPAERAESWRATPEGQAEAKIKRAVEQGLITREEGKAKLAALREMMREEALERKESEYGSRYGRLERRSPERAESGRLERRVPGETERSRFSRGELRPRPEQPLDDLGFAEDKIKWAIESGRISKAEAQGLLDELSRERAARSGARASIDEAKEKIAQAIRNGRLSKEEGRIKLEALRSEMEREREGARLQRREERDARESERGQWRGAGRLELRDSLYREGRQDRRDREESFDRRDRAERLDSDDRSGRLGRIERRDRRDRDDRRDRAERRERDDRPERGDRRDREERPERENRHERKGRGDEEGSSTVGVAFLARAGNAR